MDEYLKTILGRMAYGPQYGMSEEEIARVFPNGLPVGGTAPAFGPSGVRSLPAAMKSMQSIARRSPDLIKWIQSGRKITIGGPKWTQLTQNLTANQKNMLVKNFDAVRNFIRSDRGAQIVSSSAQTPTTVATGTAVVPYRQAVPAIRSGMPQATQIAAQTSRSVVPRARQTAMQSTQDAYQSGPRGLVRGARGILGGLTLAGIASGVANALSDKSPSERKQLGTYSDSMADILNSMNEQMRMVRMNRPEMPEMPTVSPIDLDMSLADAMGLRPVDLDISLEDALGPSSQDIIEDDLARLLPQILPRTVELERNFIPKRQITVPPVSPLRGRR